MKKDCVVLFSCLFLIFSFAACSVQNDTDSSVQSEIAASTETRLSSSSSNSSESSLSSPDEQLESVLSSALAEESSQLSDDSYISVGTIYADSTNVNMLYNANNRVGTEEELENVMSFLSSLKVEDVTLLATADMPNDTQNDYTLSYDELAQFIILINDLKPYLLPEEELGNPYTGGACFIRIEAKSQTLYITYNGWFCVNYPENKETLIFEAESNRDTFQAISAFIWKKMNNI